MKTKVALLFLAFSTLPLLSHAADGFEVYIVPGAQDMLPDSGTVASRYYLKGGFLRSSIDNRYSYGFIGAHQFVFKDGGQVPLVSLDISRGNKTKHYEGDALAKLLSGPQPLVINVFSDDEIIVATRELNQKPGAQPAPAPAPAPQDPNPNAPAAPASSGANQDGSLDLSGLDLEPAFVAKLKGAYYDRNESKAYHYELRDLAQRQLANKALRYDHIVALIRASFRSGDSIFKDYLKQLNQNKTYKPYDWAENLSPIDDTIYSCLNECSELSLEQATDLAKNLVPNSYSGNSSMALRSLLNRFPLEKQSKEQQMTTLAVVERHLEGDSLVEMTSRTLFKVSLGDKEASWNDMLAFVTEISKGISENSLDPTGAILSLTVGAAANVNSVTVANLIAFMDSAKDLRARSAAERLVNSVASALGFLKMDDVRKLREYGLSSAQAIASKVETSSKAEAIELAGMCMGETKDQVINRFLTSYTGSLSTDDILALSQSSYYRSSAIILESLGRISDLSLATAGRLSAALSGENKDTLVKAVVAKYDRMSVNELLQLSALAYYQSTNIILSNLTKLNDLTAKNLSVVGAHLSGENKDKLVQFWIDSQTKISINDLLLASNNAYYRSSAILMENVAKLDNFDLNALTLLCANVSGQNKDTLTAQFMKQQQSVSLDTLLKVSQLTYFTSTSLLMDNVQKVEGLNAEKIIMLAANVSGTNKDKLVQDYLAQQQSLSSSDLLKLSQAAYYQSTAVILQNTGKVKPLTSQVLIGFAANVSGSNKDDLILSNLDKVTDLNASTAQALSDAGYYKSKEILQKAIQILTGGK